MGHQLEWCPLNQCARDFYSSVVTASCPGVPEMPWCPKISHKDKKLKFFVLYKEIQSRQSLHL